MVEGSTGNALEVKVSESAAAVSDHDLRAFLDTPRYSLTVPSTLNPTETYPGNHYHGSRNSRLPAS
jgi:hypothetical protein